MKKVICFTLAMVFLFTSTVVAFADYYQSLYKNAINQVKTLVEPALIVMLTFTVGLIIISIIVPMFEMYKVIS